MKGFVDDSENGYEKLDLIEFDYTYGQGKLLTRDHLERLRSLEQFKKRHGIIDSHLMLYDLIDSITCLCVEGVEFMSSTNLSTKILAEIKKAEK